MAVEAPGRRRLGELLVEAQVLAPEPLAEALDRQRVSGMRLGAVLVEMGIVDEHTVVAALGAQLGLPVADLHRRPPDPEALRALPQETARRLNAIPVRSAPAGLQVAVADPLDEALVAELEQAAGGAVQLLIAAAGDVRSAIDRCYRPSRRPRRAPGAADVIDGLLSEAVGAGATAIHLDHSAAGVRARLRIDGALAPAAHTVTAEAVRRIGREPLPTEVEGKYVDLRVTWVAAAGGPAATIRISEARRAPAGLDELGLPLAVRERLDEVLWVGSGLVAVTGPRRSGLSTTLYAALAEVNTPDRLVVTVDNPPAFRVPGVVHARDGFDLVTGLDADVVLVEDVDDEATAQWAAQLARRGCIVLAGSHGGPAAAIDEALVIQQRLLRRVCPACAVPYEPTLVGLAACHGRRLRCVQGTGCDHCQGTGFAGWIGLFALGGRTGALLDEALVLVDQGLTPLAQALLLAGAPR